MAAWNPVTVNFSDANTAMAHGVNTIANVGDAARSYVKDLEEKAKYEKEQRQLAADKKAAGMAASLEADARLNAIKGLSGQSTGDNQGSIQQSLVGSPKAGSGKPYNVAVTSYVDANGKPVSAKDAFNVTTGKLNTGVAQQPVSAQAQASNAQQQLLQSGSPKLVTAKEIFKSSPLLQQHAKIDPKTKQLVGFDTREDILNKQGNFYAQKHLAELEAKNPSKTAGDVIQKKFAAAEYANVMVQKDNGKYADKIESQIKLAQNTIGKYKMKDGSTVDRRTIDALGSGKIKVKDEYGRIHDIDMSQFSKKDEKGNIVGAMTADEISAKLKENRTNALAFGKKGQTAFQEGVVSPVHAVIDRMVTNAGSSLSNIANVPSSVSNYFTKTKEEGNKLDAEARRKNLSIGTGLNDTEFSVLQKAVEGKYGRGVKQVAAPVTPAQANAVATAPVQSNGSAKSIKQLKEGIQKITTYKTVTPKAIESTVKTIDNVMTKVINDPTTKSNIDTQFNMIFDVEKKADELSKGDPELRDALLYRLGAAKLEYVKGLTEIEKEKFDRMDKNRKFGLDYKKFEFEVKDAQEKNNLTRQSINARSSGGSGSRKSDASGLALMKQSTDADEKLYKDYADLGTAFDAAWRGSKDAPGLNVASDSEKNAAVQNYNNKVNVLQDRARMQSWTQDRINRLQYKRRVE